MNLQSLVVVILRLMVLDFLLQIAIRAAPPILSFLEIYASTPNGNSHSEMVLPWLLLAALIFSAVLLWVFALPIARLVSRGVPHDLSLGALSLADCYSIAFMGVGLSYIASHLPQVLNWIFYLLKQAASSSGDSWKEGVSGYEISQVFITFIVGVVLFVNGRKWSVALARRDTASSSQTATVNPAE